jgi:hypothetical protein
MSDEDAHMMQLLDTKVENLELSVRLLKVL